MISLGACANHTFAPGPGMNVQDLGPNKAQCRLFARGSDPGYSFSAYGSPRFVAASMGGAALGAAIGSAVRQNSNFNDCMEARGLRMADDTETIGTAPTVRPVVSAADANPPVTLYPPVASGPQFSEIQKRMMPGG